jgi:D-glycero-alpha-D-manno-heptose-7-phosphate kinase
MILVRAPLRISFVGGGTDYPEVFENLPGGVIGTTIKKYVYVVINPLSPLSGEKFRFTYRETESINHVNDFKHPVVREYLKSLHWKSPINIATMADLPGKTGLGSSSSFSVAFIHAINEYSGNLLSSKEIAAAAVNIEREILGEPGGVQDQYHAAVGGFRHYSFTKSVTTYGPEILSGPDLQAISKYFYLLPFDSFRESVKEFQVAREFSAKSEGKAILNELRNLTEAINIKLSRSQNNIDQIFQILSDAIRTGFELKSRIVGKSKKSNLIIERALAHGATAAKVCGAGTTGFILLAINPENHSKVQSAFPEQKLIALEFTSLGSETLFKEGHEFFQEKSRK